LNLELAGFKFSWRGIVNFIREALNEDVQHVASEVTVLGAKITLTTRLGSESAFRISGSMAELDRMLSRSAENIYGGIDPVGLAKYLCNNRRYPQCFEAIGLAVRDKDPATKVAGYALWAEVLIYFNRYDEAESKLAEALATEPGQRWTDIIYRTATRKHKWLGIFDVDDILPRTSHLNDSRAWAHNVKGIILADRDRRWDDAVTQFKYALEAYPNASSSHVLWGRTLAAQARWKEAVAHYRQGVKYRQSDSIAPC
jgi:tetratricopeptide (TPR) repeat protein